jgi:hypothetical protein
MKLRDRFRKNCFSLYLWRENVWLGSAQFTHHPSIPSFAMKKNSLLVGATTLALLGGLAAFSFGCGKPAAPVKPVPSASATKTSFDAVTAQLDPGGNFYLYLGTAQWLEQLSTKVEAYRGIVTALPDLKAEDLGNVNKAFDIFTRLIKDSGVEEVTGLGMSSLEVEPGFYRNKALLHHYPGHDTGFLWKLGGQKPHDLTGLDLLPETTAFAIFADLDVPLLWSVIQDETTKSGFPQAQDFLQKLPVQFEAGTKVKWDAFLHSLGGEFGFVLTLNPSNTIPIPIPPSMIQVPEPGLMLALRVTDDTIFNRIDAELKSNPQVVSVNNNGLKMRTMPVPIPFVANLRPSAASTGGYLLIASSDDLINDAVAVKSGKLPGLKGTAEFKHLAQNLPTQGNQFTYLSEKFGQTIQQIQTQVIAGAAARNSSPNQSQWIQSLMNQSHPAACYAVGVNTPEGCLTVGNGNQSYANLALLPAVAVPGMLAAIAIPNFVKARATAQQNACLNNLRQIDAAKQQWALEYSKKTADVPTEKDLKPYIGRKNSPFPQCPQGGKYTIGPVGELPKCSVPGHELPH